ncbi:MAG: ATP-binding protein [Bryobacteraceae bacterium]
MGARWKTWPSGVAAIAAATAVALILRPYLAPVNLAMIYLLAVVAVAARADRITAAITAFASVAAFDLFCVPPYGTFAVTDSEYLLTFVAMLAVALVINRQTDRIRRQRTETADREARAQTLYRLSEALANETRVFEVARAAAALASEALGAQVVIFLRDGASISFDRRTSDHLPVPRSEMTIAEWVFQHGRKAGLGVDDLLKATALYVPLRGTRAAVGVMAVVPQGTPLFDKGEREVLIDLMANHTALAIERTASQNTAERSRIQMETEQMRSSLLSAVSHDLLTPLASITGAASTIRRQGEKIPPATRDELLQSISDEADRLSRLVRNLLDMTRFETGEVELRREAYPLEEIVGLALRRLDALLKDRKITVKLPDSLPLVNGDEVLLGQVFVNLLENAVKYTPPATPIEITARETDSTIEVTVRDHGPGFAPGQQEHLFEKFYRGRAGNATGTGLGLAISKAVIEAHGGTIEAFNHPDTGAVFRFHLPAIRVGQPA